MIYSNLRASANRLVKVFYLILAFVLIIFSPSISFAQPGDANNSEPVDMVALANAAKAPKPAMNAPSASMDLVDLLIKGGWFMVPIGFVSLLAAAFAIERLIGLRSAKLYPNILETKLVTLMRDGESIDPRAAYPICIEHPSAASNVVRAVLLRAGRPMSELEAVARETSQREADKAYSGVRWLVFAAGLAPLLGLLGTVWGLIQAFHDMTLLTPSQNRADFLGRGIYIALVTTLAGLVVAIPTSFVSHWFESRIKRYFHRIEELLAAIIPKLERYEGKYRFEAIGRELAAKNTDLPKKTISSPDVGKQPAAPPVQTVTFSSNAPHSPAQTAPRKPIYKP
jgi:biopolymer transport protein ExbB